MEKISSLKFNWIEKARSSEEVVKDIEKNIQEVLIYDGYQSCSNNPLQATIKLDTSLRRRSKWDERLGVKDFPMTRHLNYLKSIRQTAKNPDVFTEASCRPGIPNPCSQYSY